MAVIIMEAVLLHLLDSGSRNDANSKFQKKQIVKAVSKYFKIDLDKLSHLDNVEKIFQKLSVEELQNFLIDIIKKLIRSKKIKPTSFPIENFITEKYFIIAIDMTQTQKFKTNISHGKTIKGLLFQTVNGKKNYFRRAVEAKLLLPNKMSLPIMTEFVSNDDYENGKFTKQDCELKAAYRLMDKLKVKFPKLKIILTLDGLYPNQTIFKKAEEYNWKYIITLKEDKIPNLYKRFEELKKVNYYETKKKIIDKITNQRFKFLNDLKYLEHKLSIVEMNEYVKDKGKNYHNVFVTNIKIDKNNVYSLCKIGRLRWKIEHAFNRQKKLLFNLTHVFSINENASQCFHITLQIADLIYQFMAYSFNKNGKNILLEIYGSLKRFLNEIYVSFSSDISDYNKYFLQKHLILIEPKT